jgi:hypothetical protein
MTDVQNLPPESRPMANRFRGFLPVVVDVETGGFDCRRHALLQVAAVFLRRGPDDRLYRERTLSLHVRPFEGGLLDPKSLEVNGIDPFHPCESRIRKTRPSGGSSARCGARSSSTSASGPFSSAITPCKEQARKQA